MRMDVQIHKVSQRRGAIVPAGSVEWAPGDLAEFDVVTLELTAEQVEDIRRHRLRVWSGGRLDAVPPKDWPEEQSRADALEQFLRAEIDGITDAEYKRRAAAMTAAARGG